MNKAATMTTHTFQKRRVVVRSIDGRYWTKSRDGPSWVNSIDLATLHDPKFCTRPEDATWENSPDRIELKAAKLLPVTVTTIYEVEEP